jgi:chromosome partitioning protein
MRLVTDPEELRSRAASIFERLRKGAGRTAENGQTEHDLSPDDALSSGKPPTPGEPATQPEPERATEAEVSTTGEPSSAPASSADQGEADPPLPDDAVDAGEVADAHEVADARQTGAPEAAMAGAASDTADVSKAGEAVGAAEVADGSDGADATGAGEAPGANHDPAPDMAQSFHPGQGLGGDGELSTEPPGAASDEQTAVAGTVPDVVEPAPALTIATEEPLDGAAAAASSFQNLPADLPSLGDGTVPRPQGWRGRRPLPRILAIANQKGGVGKTTTAVNLGAALAELGYRVLVVDLDPQGNATTGLGINARNLDASIYDVLLHDVPLEDCIEPTSLRNLFVVPATIDLAGAEIELVPVFSRELRLRRALAQVGDDFDFTLIDCPPSLGLLTVNGLAAATEVVVPIQCEYYALEGLGQLLRNVNLVQSNLNAELEVTTIILTMYDARTRLAEQVVAEVRSHFGDRVCRNVVPRTVRLSEAPSFGQPIIVFDSSSRGAIAYRELAKEVSGGAPQRIG